MRLIQDLTRVRNRLKALYRSWAIPCSGTQVLALRHRSEWLGKITEAGVRRRAERFYQQFDALRPLRKEVRFYKDFRNLRLAIVAKNREIRKQRVQSRFPGS